MLPGVTRAIAARCSAGSTRPPGADLEAVLQQLSTRLARFHGVFAPNSLHRVTIEKILNHLKAREANPTLRSTQLPPPRAPPLLPGWEQGAKDTGKWRLEGKEYIAQVGM